MSLGRITAQLVAWGVDVRWLIAEARVSQVRGLYRLMAANHRHELVERTEHMTLAIAASLDKTANASLKRMREDLRREDG